MGSLKRGAGVYFYGKRGGVAGYNDEEEGLGVWGLM